MEAEADAAVAGTRVGVDRVGAPRCSVCLPVLSQIQLHPCPERDPKPRERWAHRGQKRQTRVLVLSGTASPRLNVQRSMPFPSPGVFQSPQGSTYCLAPHPHPPQGWSFLKREKSMSSTTNPRQVAEGHKHPRFYATQNTGPCGPLRVWEGSQCINQHPLPPSSS